MFFNTQQNNTEFRLSEDIVIAFLQRKFVILLKMRLALNLTPLYVCLPGDDNPSCNISKVYCLVSIPQGGK